MDRATKIAAARRYAPPLFSYEPLDRRGARLRQVNRGAVDYAARAGLTLNDVYPNAIHIVRGMAPPPGGRDARRFSLATGLPIDEIYPSPFAGEAPKKRRRWVWTIAGLVTGGVVGGVVGLVAGGALGAFVGGGR